MNIFVGNLNYDSTEEGLRALFEQHGSVDSAKIITDRDSGRSRGFGFVEMPNDDEANAAMQELNGYTFDERPLRVNEARPKEDKGPRRDNW